MESVYKPFSIILSTFGFELGQIPKRSVIILVFRIKTWIMLTSMVIYSLDMYIRRNGQLNSEDSQQYFNLYILSFHIKTWFIFLSFIMFNWEFTAINQLLIKIEQNLNQKNKK